ncbi:MAG: hypothetical protein MRJ68_09515 [Nitrospira sp.]|nr:hypothetical protein [Nitrospira sp.]
MSCLRLAMVGVLGVSLPSDSVTTSAVAAQRPFVVFDATLYKNKPSFSGYPIRPIKLLYESRLFPKGQPHEALPPEGTVRSVAKELRGAPEGVVIDIERWPLKGDPKIVKENVGKILAILSWIKAEAPDPPAGSLWNGSIAGLLASDSRPWEQRLSGVATGQRPIG